MLKQFKTIINTLENTEEISDRVDMFNTLLELMLEKMPFAGQPVGAVKWVPIDKVTPNDYNPNTVAKQEMKLLKHSISQNNYTQPVVVVYDPDEDVYTIVDGFHRYFVMKTSKEIYERTGGYMPVAIISTDVNDRMAATVRHNRARGKHLVDGMANMVFEMLENGMTDESICNELGMEPEELVRLKHVTGFSKLFEDHAYTKSWITDGQTEVRKAHNDAEGDGFAAYLKRQNALSKG